MEFAVCCIVTTLTFQQNGRYIADKEIQMDFIELDFQHLFQISFKFVLRDSDGKKISIG